MNRIRIPWRILTISALFGAALLTAAGAKADSSDAGAYVDTKEMDGELYVKASSLTSSIGGSFAYDAETESYRYVKPNPIPEAIAKVSPAVVGIIGKPMDGGDPGQSNRFDLAHGTGVIIRSNGLIVTNAHVVNGMQNLVVVTADGKQYAAHTTHLDEESDLALVKIAASDLPTAAFADKLDTGIGETVIAIGTPISFSLRNSVTVGVLSGMDRSIHSTYRLLQTDAAINPGNSGGPLINEKGEVIGINSLKFASVGVDSLGFAIPCDTVNYVIDQFMKYGKVNRPYSGLELEESWAAVVGLPTTDPLNITRVDEGSPAEKAGIRKGDVLYSIDDQNLSTLVDYNEQLKRYGPGDSAKLVLLSADGDLVTKTITFAGN